MKATVRIGRGSAKHNTHSFEAEHIDKNKTVNNVYWTWKNGFTEEENLIKDEALFYEENYTDYLNRQNEKYRQRRQYAKVKTMEEYQKATQLDEILLQIGKMGETVEPELLQQIVDDYIKQLEKQYGKNVHVVSYALHTDEATPHIHLRVAYDYINKENIKQYGIDKALTALGFKQPKADKKEDRWNNKKIAFTDKLRSEFYDLCDLYLIDRGRDLINRIVENPSHRHLKTELYKSKKQQEENEKMEIENNHLKTAINQSKRELEELKKKVSNSEDEKESLNNQVSSAKKELDDLKAENDKLNTMMKNNKKNLDKCIYALVEAEEKDIKALGYSPLTKYINELQKQYNNIDFGR